MKIEKLEFCDLDMDTPYVRKITDKVNTAIRVVNELTKKVAELERQNCSPLKHKD